MNELQLKRYNKDCYQIIVKGEVAAFAMKYSNGNWGLSDTDDKRITGSRFSKPREVFQYYLDSHLIDSIND